MKAKLIIALAAVAMLFTACNKDNNIKAGNNELVYHGTVYQLDGSVCYGSMEDMEDAYMIDGIQNVENPLFSFIADARVSTVNHTYNLPDGLPGDGKLYFFVAAEENSPVPGLSLEEGNFKSGTVTVSYDDEAFVFAVDAVLDDNTNFSVNIYKEKSSIENCW
jgi:hypothetical protein